MKINLSSNLNRNAVPRNDESSGRSDNKSFNVNQKPSFGSLKDLYKGGVSSVMGSVERHGFLAEFFLVDALSMIIPRVVIGLNRDREKTGKINYKAGAEEAGRELLSGPSMLMIPIGVVGLYKLFKPAVKVPRAVMNEFSTMMSDVVASSDASALKKDVLDKQLAGKIFDKSFASHNLGDAKNALKGEFVNALTLPKSKENRAAFEKVVIKINNKNKATEPLSVKNIELAKGVGVKAQDLFDDFNNYSKDIINKLVKKDFAKSGSEGLKKVVGSCLEKMQNARKLTRIFASVTSFAAVGAFLLIIPKIYLKSKTSPAMDSANLASGKKKEGVA